MFSQHSSANSGHTKKHISFCSVMQSHRVGLLRSHYERIRIKREGDREREGYFSNFFQGLVNHMFSPGTQYTT